MDCSAGCTEIAGSFATKYEFSLATMRACEDCEVVCSIADVMIVVCYRRRLETRPFRRLLICTPVTDVRRLLICTSVTLVRLLVCTPITLLRRLLACIRTVRRLLVCIGSTRLLTCSPGTRVRGLLTCTTTNHPCVITVGRSVLPPKVTLPGSEVGEGRTVAFITVLGDVVPAAFAAVPSASSTTASGGGVIVSVPLT